MARGFWRKGSWLARLLAMSASTLCAAALVATAAPATAYSGRCGDPAQRPWCDTALGPDQRSDLLLKQLTTAEKISLLAGVSTAYTGQTQAIDRVGLPSVEITDDGVGVKRLGPSTALPVPIALAATFDQGMATVHGTVVGNETRAKGADIILGPTMNMMRTPLGGRTFEAYGEDPYLVAHMTTNWIKAAQAQGVIAEAKHFCCNNQEGQLFAVCEKMYCSSDVDERTLREVYLPQFESAVKNAGVGTIMCAYNRVNDDWACENRHLLTDILKGEWAFPGFVVSDWQAVHESPFSMKNGLDLEMPTAMDYDPRVINAELTAGVITMADIDDHVHRFLRTLFAFGFFERPAYLNNDKQIDTVGHAKIAQAMEEQGMVLMQNQGILPLDRTRLKSIALIGPQANRYEDGKAENITPFTYTTPLQSIKQHAGPGVKVAYDDGSSSTSAASTAAAADIAIVFASDSESEDMEKTCTSVDCSLGFPGIEAAYANQRPQESLIATVAAANPNTIVVLETGDPVTTPWRTSVKGIVEAWYPGEEGGEALARVLFGETDPGGRLPATFPAKESDIPAYGDPTQYPGVTDATYKEGVFIGYRWYDKQGFTPAFAFGSGLSYTTFRFDNLQVAPYSVSLDVTNTGGRAGWAVPQLYLGLPSPSASVPQPPRQLRGFRKLWLNPGQTQSVTFYLNQRDFSYWDVNSSSWKVAAGCYGVFAGSNERDLPLKAAISQGGASCPGAVNAATTGATSAGGAGLPATGSPPPLWVVWAVAISVLGAIAGWRRFRA